MKRGKIRKKFATWFSCEVETFLQSVVVHSNVTHDRVFPKQHKSDFSAIFVQIDIEKFHQKIKLPLEKIELAKLTLGGLEV